MNPETEMVVVGSDAGTAVMQVMKAEGLNQTQLASMMGCNRQAVQQSLNRRSGNMRAETLRRMVEAMGWKVVFIKQG